MSVWEYTGAIVLILLAYNNERLWNAIKEGFYKLMKFIETGNWK